MFQWLLDSFFGWFYVLFWLISTTLILGSFQLKKWNYSWWQMALFFGVTLSGYLAYLCFTSAHYQWFGIGFFPIPLLGIWLYNKQQITPQ